jgi:signal recognition particle receptor subunit beta
MAFTNFETKEINCKIVYFGPRAAGKTANLRSVYSQTSAEVRSGLLELGEQDGPTTFFDFLPISLGQVRDFHLKLHLFTLPANPLYESVASVVLRGLDGVVFVADSRIEALPENIEVWDSMRRIVTKEGYAFTDVPKVVQYNKRDIKDAVPIDILRSELNSVQAPEHEAIATQSIGTMETLQSMAKLVIKQLS